MDRKKLENHIYKTINLLDPSGTNTIKYKNMFSKMSDTQFNKYMKDFLYDEEENFYIEIEPYVNDLQMDSIEKAAESIGVPLFEHIVYPSYTDDNNGNVVVSPQPVPVGYILMKKLQQFVMKKNSMSIKTDTRNAKTGQVTSSDKNGRVSDMEMNALKVMNCNAVIKEFMHSRSDNMKAKNELMNNIKRDGYVSVNELSNNPQEKVALNTLDVMFTSAMVKTNLVTNGLLLKRTNQNQNKDVSSIGSKYVKK